MFQKLMIINIGMILQKKMFPTHFLFPLSLFIPFNEVLGQNVSWSFTYLTTQQLNTNKA
ncbi:hypothetical protein MCERE19_00461 [Spirosomataceae bacterium]|jgi:hypothetical protein